MLDLRQFAVLRAIGQTGSLSGAGKTLHLSLPSVTHHLDALERHLGVRLVDRGPRGSRLTAVGELFVTDLEDVLGRLGMATQRAMDARTLGTVTLRVGTFASAGARILPEALRSLGTSVDLRLVVHEGEPAHLTEQVRAGKLDCALIYDLDGDPALASPDLTRQELDAEAFSVIASQDCDLAGASVIDFGELAAYPWVRSHEANGASERQLLRLSEAAGFEPRTLTRTDDYGMLHGFVSAGLAVALVADASIDTRFAVSRLIVREPLGARRIAFVLPTVDPAPVAELLGSILTRVDNATARFVE